MRVFLAECLGVRAVFSSYPSDAQFPVATLWIWLDTVDFFDWLESSLTSSKKRNSIKLLRRLAGYFQTSIAMDFFLPRLQNEAERE